MHLPSLAWSMGLDTRRPWMHGHDAATSRCSFHALHVAVQAGAPRSSASVGRRTGARRLAKQNARRRRGLDVFGAELRSRKWRRQSGKRLVDRSIHASWGLGVVYPLVWRVVRGLESDGLPVNPSPFSRTQLRGTFPIFTRISPSRPLLNVKEKL